MLTFALHFHQYLFYVAKVIMDSLKCDSDIKSFVSPIALFESKELVTIAAPMVRYSK